MLVIESKTAQICQPNFPEGEKQSHVIQSFKSL